MSQKVSTKDAARNLEWDLHINHDGTWPTEKIQVALLADIRAELKKLNAVLHCHNFLEIPQILRAVKKNTTKKKRPKGKPQLRVVSNR